MSPAAPSERNARIGAKIRRRRQALDWDQKDLADRVGVHVGSVQKWESGKFYPGRKLGKIEAVLGISLSDEPDEPEDLLPPGLRDRVREMLPPDRAAVVEAAIEAALRGEPPPNTANTTTGRHARAAEAG
jgi:transcriptional regulator with XRE-family HTH domain